MTGQTDGLHGSGMSEEFLNNNSLRQGRVSRVLCYHGKSWSITVDPEQQ